MILQIQDILTALRAVRQVRDTIKTYCLAPNLSKPSIDDFTYAVHQAYDIEIKVYEVPVAQALLRGMIEVYQTEAKIYLSAEQNDQYLRYVTVKEICHIIAMTESNSTLDPVLLIEHMVQDGQHIKNGDEQPTPPDVAAEEIAKISATEFLFPFNERQAAKEKIAKGEGSLFSISQEVELPEHVVEWLLSDHWMGVCALLESKL